jgi:hypothetical protein
MTEPQFTGEDRREQASERRRYTRRSAPAGSPPYFEAFERIAVALETMVSLLEQRSVTLPDAQPRRPVRPRTSTEA